MKVVHIVEATFAGVGRHVLDLAEAQSSEGLDVTVVYSGERETQSFERRRAGLSQVEWIEASIPSRPNASLASALINVAKAVKTLEPDILHGHSTMGGMAARACGVGGKAKVLYTPNAVFSMNPLQARPARFVAASAELMMSLSTDHIVAVSPEERDHLLGLRVRSDISVIPNGIPQPPPAEKAAVRAELGLPSDGTVVGFVGRLDSQKAPTHLVEVARIALVADSKVVFCVIGDGPMMDDVRGLASTYGIDMERFRMLGERDGQYSMNAFDVLLIPSAYEGFPYVIIEAVHQGVPVVASDRCSASLFSGGNAIVEVAEYGDYSAMAEACLRVGQLRPLRDERFSIEAMSRATTVAYQKALGYEG